MCVLETVMRPSLFPGRLCMRQLIGSVLLLAAVGLAPAELAAQRRPAARSAASRADRPSFGLQLNWSSDVDFGIGGRGVFPLQDRKSTRLNSSHLVISYAVFCLKKKK